MASQQAREMSLRANKNREDNGMRCSACTGGKSSCSQVQDAAGEKDKESENGAEATPLGRMFAFRAVSELSLLSHWLRCSGPRGGARSRIARQPPQPAQPPERADALALNT